MKKKVGPDLSLYAYNSEFINKPKINKNGGFNFASLTKGFYDDIVSVQQSIKESKTDLNVFKTNAVKESVYSNKNVPSSWKTKLNYRNHICKAIYNDNDFAIYLGKKEEHNPMEVKLNHFLGNDDLNIMNQTGINLLPKIIKKHKDISTTIQRRNTMRHTQKYTAYLTVQNKDQNYLSDKEIASKLDEYKSKFDMDEYMVKLRQHKEEETKRKFLITETKEDNKDEKASPYYTMYSNGDYKKMNHKKNKLNKAKVFKSSVYINLLPKDTVEINENEDKRAKMKTQTDFLYLEKEEPIEITNPKKKRELEIINYYGPRYNYCSICNRKNLEFYQNFETKQCFKLLSYLKNERVSKRKMPISQEHKSPKNKEENV